MNTVRHLALAAWVGSIVAAMIDLVLRNALEAARVAATSLTPWWVVGNLLERGVWIAAAALSWALAPAVARWWHAGPLQRATGMSRHEAFRAMGAAFVVLPLVWLAAVNLVRVLWLTLTGAWELEGQIFASSTFYTNALTDLFPWGGAGAVLLTVSGHLARGEAAPA